MGENQLVSYLGVPEVEWWVAGGMQPAIDTSLGRTLNTGSEYSLRLKISAHLIFRKVNKF